MNRLFAFLLFLPSIAWAQTPPASRPSVPPSTNIGRAFSSDCPYPESARQAGIQGMTGVTYGIGNDHIIRDVTLDATSGNADLDNAAVDCVGKWQISPSTRDPDQFVGPHRVTISWYFPAATAGTPAEPPIGRRYGRSHNCFYFYPTAEAASGIEGTTTLHFTVTADGAVRDVTVLNTSGNANLDNAATRCAGYWRYKPAVENGKAIAVPWKANVVWKLVNEYPPVGAFPNWPRDCAKSFSGTVAVLVGIDGTTQLSFQVVDGKMTNIVVTHSSGNAELDQAAIACISKSRFRPTGKTPDILSGQTKVSWKDALAPTK